MCCAGSIGVPSDSESEAKTQNYPAINDALGAVETEDALYQSGAARGHRSADRKMAELQWRLQVLINKITLAIRETSCSEE